MTASTARHPCREDPGRVVTETTVLTAAVASLGAVALFLGGFTGQGAADIQAVTPSSASRWPGGPLHIIFTTRYARLYYTNPPARGVDFYEKAAPQYSDFAYLAFTIGTTFEVSDTDLRSKATRATALRHVLLSYTFGAIIIIITSTTINLVAGMAKSHGKAPPSPRHLE